MTFMEALWGSELNQVLMRIINWLFPFSTENESSHLQRLELYFSEITTIYDLTILYSLKFNFMSGL